jgi:hypothetical protein
MLWACAVSWRSRAASRWPIAPAHRCTASDTVKDSSVIIASNAAPVRCSVAAMVESRSPSAVNTSMTSFSRRRSRSAGSRRRFAHTSDAASLAACLNVCLPVPASSSTKTRIPYGLSGWPSSHHLRSSLNGLLPQTQRIPCLTGLNPRVLDPQTSAACPRTSKEGPTSLKIGIFALERISVDKPKWWSKWWSDP